MTLYSHIEPPVTLISPAWGVQGFWGSGVWGVVFQGQVGLEGLEFEDLVVRQRERLRFRLGFRV